MSENETIAMAIREQRRLKAIAECRKIGMSEEAIDLALAVVDDYLAGVQHQVDGVRLFSQVFKVTKPGEPHE